MPRVTINFATIDFSSTRNVLSIDRLHCSNVNELYLSTNFHDPFIVNFILIKKRFGGINE